MQQQINVLEQSALQAVKLTAAFKILQTITGIGKILGLTIVIDVSPKSRAIQGLDSQDDSYPG